VRIVRGDQHADLEVEVPSAERAVGKFHRADVLVVQHEDLEAHPVLDKQRQPEALLPLEQDDVIEPRGGRLGQRDGVAVETDGPSVLGSDLRG
jgi:hypothetical protein